MILVVIHDSVQSVAKKNSAIVITAFILIVKLLQWNQRQYFIQLPNNFCHYFFIILFFFQRNSCILFANQCPSSMLLRTSHSSFYSITSHSIHFAYYSFFIFSFIWYNCVTSDMLVFGKIIPPGRHDLSEMKWEEFIRGNYFQSARK